MGKVKVLLIFLAGIMAGGLLFGFNGPLTSRAAGQAPENLLYLAVNSRSGSNYTQYYGVRTKYANQYKITGTRYASGDPYAVVIFAAK